MKFKLIIHEAEEGGYWAQVPSIKGCATQGDTIPELLSNLCEAIEGCLSVKAEDTTLSSKRPVISNFSEAIEGCLSYPASRSPYPANAP